MKRRCPHCREATIGLGALLKGELRSESTTCSNCGHLVRSRHAVSGLRNATDLAPGLLLNPYGWIVLAVVVATYFGMGSAIAAVIAAITAGMLALVLIPIAFPLQIAAPKIRDSRISQHPRLALIRAGVLLLAWFGVVVLAGILLVRVIAAVG